MRESQGEVKEKIVIKKREKKIERKVKKTQIKAYFLGFKETNKSFSFT